jgi:hypothetical protein
MRCFLIRRNFVFYIITTIFTFTFGSLFYFGVNFYKKTPDLDKSICCVDSFAKSESISSITEKKVKLEINPSGCFSFANKPNKAFRNIDWISINTGTPWASSDGRHGWIDEVPSGAIFTNNGVYNWKSENALKGNEITFKTEEIEGISYKLEAQFLRTGNYEITKPKGAVLKGKLSKIVEGESVLEEELEFNWSGWSELYLTEDGRIKKAKSGGKNF